MKMMRLPPGNMREIIQIRTLSTLKDLDHEVGIGDLSETHPTVGAAPKRSAVTFRRRFNSYLVYCLGLTRPLCYDQPEILTQGPYYPRVDSVAINAARRRRELLLE